MLDKLSKYSGELESMQKLKIHQRYYLSTSGKLIVIYIRNYLGSC